MGELFCTSTIASSRKRSRGRSRVPFFCSFLRDFLGAHLVDLLGTAWAGCKGGLQRAAMRGLKYVRPLGSAAFATPEQHRETFTNTREESSQQES